MANACIFCGRDDERLTGEHVFPNWMTKAIPHESDTDYPLSRTHRSDGGISKHQRLVPRPVGQQVVKVVCKSCNTGWMSVKLEAQAKPFLTEMGHGRPALLRAPELRLLATWLSKTAMVREQVNPQATAFTQDQRVWLMTRLAPPPWSFIWVGRMEQSSSPVSTATVYTVPSMTVVNETSTMSVTTLAFGELIAQVLTCTDQLLHEVFSDHFPTWATQNLGLDVVQIWPPTGVEMTWPPHGGIIPQGAFGPIRRQPFTWLCSVMESEGDAGGYADDGE